MFNISLSEIGVVGAVAMLVLGPKEFKNVIQYSKYIIRSIKETINRHVGYLDNEIGSITNHIIDLDGRVQPTYETKKDNKQLKNVKRKVSKKKL